MTEAKAPQTPEQQVRAECARILQEAVEARRFARPSADAEGRPVYNAMVQVRERLDRLEICLKQLIAIRSSARIVARDRNDKVQDEWDKQAASTGGPRLGRDFEGKEERYARWNLAVLPHRMSARQAQRVADVISSTEEQVRASYFGMRDLQKELLQSLRFLEWEASIERG